MKLKADFKIVSMGQRQFVLFAAPDGAASQPYGVNETACRLLELLRSESSVDSLLAALQNEYDVDKAQLAQDVEEYLANLRKMGMLEE